MSILENYKNIKKRIAEMTPNRQGLATRGSGTTVPETTPPTNTLPTSKHIVDPSNSWNQLQPTNNSLVPAKGGGAIGSLTYPNQQPAEEPTVPPEKHTYDPATDPAWADPNSPRTSPQQGGIHAAVQDPDPMAVHNLLQSNTTELPVAKESPVIKPGDIVPTDGTGDTGGAGDTDGTQTTGTEAEKILDEQILADAQGESTEVAAARDRLDREKILRMDQARRKAHDAAVRAGYRPGTQQYDQMMRNAVDGANRANIAAENELNAFARQTRMGIRDQLAAIGERDYGRGRHTRSDRLEDIALLMKHIPTDKARELAALGQFMGDDLNTILGRLFNDDGTWVQDPSKLELAQKEFDAAIDSMEVDPNTREPWASPEAKEEYKQLTWSQLQENILNPISTTRDQRDVEQNAKDALDTAIESGDFSGINPSQWDVILKDPKSRERMEASLPQYSPGDSKLEFTSVQGWLDSPLKADVVSISGKDEHNASAGDGKGSIIMYNGRPMRIVLLNSTKQDEPGIFMFGTEREYTLTGEYLDGNKEQETIGGSDGYFSV